MENTKEQQGKSENITKNINIPPLAEKYEDKNFIDTSKPVWNYSILYDDDIITFQQGTHYSLYKKFGSKPLVVLDKEGYYFCVWAPNATKLSVIGDFNDWNPETHLLHPRWDKSGIWEGFIPGVKKGEVYKYHIHGFKGIITEKGDPFANHWEHKPKTATITWEFDYDWKDEEWMQKRKKHNALDAPWSVYEVHLASWMRPDPSNEDA